MDYSSLVRELRHTLPGLAVREDEPLARHSSFRIGGPAPLLFLPKTADQLAALCVFLRQKGIRPFLFGNGTNLLFPDSGLSRPAVKTCSGGAVPAVHGTALSADCGVTLASAALAARDAGLTGLEFAHGIPGSVGGGVIMNAGAYGGELKDVITETSFLDEELLPHTLTGSEHDFSYRHSAFSDRDIVVLRCVFTLAPGSRETITETMRTLSEKRRASQPLDLPSAGSTFKRPAGAFAAALIDEAGLKGVSVGGAQVSPKHAGFVVNTGGATCRDVLRLMDLIRERVYAGSGILLEPEVRIVRG